MLSHGQYDISNVRMPPKQCEYNMWIIKPAESGTSKEAIIVNSVTDITTYLTHCRKDMIIQKLIERPLIINNFKCSVRLYILITDSGDVFVYRAPLVHLASLPYVPVTVGETSTAEECTQVHVTSPTVQYTAPGFGTYVRGNTLSWYELQTYLDTNYPVGTFPPKVLDTIILPRMKRIIVDAVRGAFASPLPNVPVMDTGSTNSTSSNPRAGFRGRRCFEFLSCDFLLDEDIRPWFLGFNENPELNLHLTSRHTVTYERMMQEIVTTVIDPLFPAPVLSQSSSSSSPVRTKNNSTVSTTTNGGYSHPSTGGPILPTPGFSSNDYMAAVTDTPTGPTALQMAMSGQKSLIQRAAEARATSGSSIQRQPQDITNSTVTIPPHRFLLPSIDDDTNDENTNGTRYSTNPLNLPKDHSNNNNSNTTLPSIVGFEPDNIAPFWELVHRSIAADDVETPAYTSMMFAALSSTHSHSGNNSSLLPYSSSATSTRINNAVQLQISEALSLTLPPRSRSIMSIPSYAFLGPAPTPHKLAWLAVGKPQSELIMTHLPSVKKSFTTNNNTMTNGGNLPNQRHESIVSNAASSISPSSVGKYTTVDSSDIIAPRPILPPELRPSAMGNLPMIPEDSQPNPNNHSNDGNSYTQDDDNLDMDEEIKYVQDSGMYPRNTDNNNNSSSSRRRRITNDQNSPTSHSPHSMDRSTTDSAYRSRSPGYEVVKSRSSSPTNYQHSSNNSNNGRHRSHSPEKRTMPASASTVLQPQPSNDTSTLLQLASLLATTGLANKIDSRSLPALAHLLQSKTNNLTHPKGSIPPSSSTAKVSSHPNLLSKSNGKERNTTAGTKTTAAVTKISHNATEYGGSHGSSTSNGGGKPLLNTLSARARANAVARKMNNGPQELKKSSRWANVQSRTDTGQAISVVQGNSKLGKNDTTNVLPPSLTVPMRNKTMQSNTQDTAIYVEEPSLSTLARAESIPDGPRHQRATAASTARKLPYDQYLLQQQQQQLGSEETVGPSTMDTVNPAFVLDGSTSTTGNGSSNSNSPVHVPNVPVHNNTTKNENDMKGLLIQLLTVLQNQGQGGEQPSTAAVPQPLVLPLNTSMTQTIHTVASPVVGNMVSRVNSPVSPSPPVIPPPAVKSRPTIVNEFSAYASLTLPSSTTTGNNNYGSSKHTSNGIINSNNNTMNGSNVNAVPHKFITSASSAYIQDPLANHSTKLSSMMKTTLHTPLTVPSQPGSYEMMLAAPYMYPSKGIPDDGSYSNNGTNTTIKSMLNNINRFDMLNNYNNGSSSPSTTPLPLSATAHVLPGGPSSSVNNGSTLSTSTAPNTVVVTPMFLPSLANPTVQPLVFPSSSKPVVVVPPLPLPGSSSSSSTEQNNINSTNTVPPPLRTPTVQFILPTVSYKKGNTANSNNTSNNGSGNDAVGHQHKNVNIDDLLRSERIPSSSMMHTNGSSSSNNNYNLPSTGSSTNENTNSSNLFSLNKRPVMTTVSINTNSIPSTINPLEPENQNNNGVANGTQPSSNMPTGPIIAMMDVSPSKLASSTVSGTNTTNASLASSRHTFGLPPSASTVSSVSSSLPSSQAILQALSTNPPPESSASVSNGSSTALTFPSTPAMTVPTSYARLSAAALAAAAASGKAVAMPLPNTLNRSQSTIHIDNFRFGINGNSNGIGGNSNSTINPTTTTNTTSNNNGDVWIRVKNNASDGIHDPYYYYHRDTRVTVWDRPTGSNVQILDQN